MFSLSADDINSEVEFLFKTIKEKYGDRLNQDELQKVKHKIKSVVKASNDIRDIPINEEIEPSIIFRPYRGDP